MWVRLRCVKRIDRQGVMRTFQPGDWVDVGKQMALLWMSQGDAEIPTYTGAEPLSGQAGLVVVNGQSLERYAPLLQQGKLPLNLIAVDRPQMCFELNLIWDGKVTLRPELLAAGFGFLSTWEVACPLWSYTDLASSVGTEEERARTKEVVHDLRVPLYETGLMFVKDTESTQNLFRLWDKERGDEVDTGLAFLRAFYQVKPLMLALPLTWTQPKVYADA